MFDHEVTDVFFDLDHTLWDFEKNSANTIDKNKAGKAVYVAGATILHELCHWGNHNNIPPVPEVIEMGVEFEKATYGKVIY